MTIVLTQQKCEACEGGVAPLNKTEAEILMQQTPGWSLSDDVKSIYRDYEFRDFRSALAFVNRVGELAESEGHHPDIHLTNFKHVRIDLTTHAIDGLSNNDLILAAKIDA